MTTTSVLAGSFVWEEFTSSDIDRAVEFYSAVMGWTFGEQMDTAHSYRLISAGEITIGGAFEHAEFTPSWTSYVGVSNVDDATARARELGAEVIREPFDVGEWGRMSVLRDPSGAVVSAWQVSGDEQPRPKVHGTLAWRELRTTDPEVAIAFYSEWLGWNIEPQDMGEFTYWMLTNNGEPIGGLMQLTRQMMGEHEVPSYWRPVFFCDDVDAAYAAATGHGATTLMEPGDIGFGYYAELIDPEGANFGLMLPVDAGS